MASKKVRLTPTPSGPALVRPAVGVLLLSLSGAACGDDGTTGSDTTIPTAPPPMPNDEGPMPDPSDTEMGTAAGTGSATSMGTTTDVPTAPPPMPDPTDTVDSTGTDTGTETTTGMGTTGTSTSGNGGGGDDPPPMPPPPPDPSGPDPMPE